MDITTEIAKAKKVAASATALAARLEQHGHYSTRAMYDLFDFYKAAIDLASDGDFLAQLHILMEELRIDEDGNPLDENREPITRVSFGMHHPDSPSFGAAA